MSRCAATNCTEPTAWRIITQGFAGGDTDLLWCRLHSKMPALPEISGQYTVHILGPFDETGPKVTESVAPVQRELFEYSRGSATRLTAADGTPEPDLPSTVAD